MCELDEKFVDVIVKRYVNLTGDAKGTYLIRDGSRISYSDVFVDWNEKKEPFFAYVKRLIHEYVSKKEKPLQ